ncbi:MAG: [FeFe] hydrogenase H-cluster maturation GTPase HydF [Candidatus Izemoplasmataceae bacterium]
MSLQSTPRSNRAHIAIFGRRNVGKSSVINAISAQDIALVSSELGTTTDPVYKSMEILPIGPVVLIDTAGIDDDGALGKLRVSKTMSVIPKADIGLIIIDVAQKDFSYENTLIEEFKKRKKPYVVIANKDDLEVKREIINETFDEVYFVSALTKQGIHELKEVLGKKLVSSFSEKPILGDIISPKDVVVLVTPIDSAAPKGRMILPQQQTIRDILDHDGIVMTCKETELVETLESLKNAPSLVVTDSQAFGYVSKVVPRDVPLTSFSILFARHKGDLDTLIRGVFAIHDLKDGAHILVSEGCTHHRQKDDIGTVKIPRWLKEHTKKEFDIDYTSGYGFQRDLDQIDMIIHCGACMLNASEMHHRITEARNHNVPIVNYGVLIAYLHDILERTIEPFKDSLLLYEKLKKETLKSADK